MDFAHRWHDRKLNIALAKFGFLLTLLTLVGCGGKPAKVSGVVTLDGKPLERGMVGFAPIDGGMRAAGMIQSDGSYTLSTNRESGLDTGEYLTTVVSREPGVENPQGGPPMPGPYITPRHYAIAKTSELRFQVEAGSNTIDIELSPVAKDAGRKTKKRGRR
jgi:hypothetical protein